MTILFEGDFEANNLLEFDQVIGNVTVISLNALSGNYSGRCQTVGTGSETTPERAYVVKNISSRKFCYAQMLVRVNDNLLYDGNRVTLITFVDGTDPVGAFGFQRVGGALKWYLIKATRPFAATGPIVGAKHIVEVYQDLTEGLVLYVDGVEVLRLPEVSPGNITGVRFGVALSNTNYPISIDIDDCRIADAYIGPVMPRLTINSSPELNVSVYIDTQFVGNTPVIVEAEGSHSVRVDAEVERTVKYYFKQWEDGSSSYTRTVNVTTDMTLTAFYSEEKPPTPCFIATAAYGTPFAQEINVIRLFRDNFMSVTAIGRKLVEIYYRISPPIARAVAQHNTLKALVRALLKPIIHFLQK